MTWNKYRYLYTWFFVGLRFTRIDSSGHVYFAYENNKQKEHNMIGWDDIETFVRSFAGPGVDR